MGFYGGRQLSVCKDQEFLAGGLFCLSDQHSFLSTCFPLAPVYKAVRDRQGDQDLDLFPDHVSVLSVLSSLCSPSEMAILVGILWFVFHSALYRPSVGPQVAVALL